MPYPTLPATLSTGIISIYGVGSTISTVSGLVSNPGFYFGEINQVNIYSSYAIGDSVMFPENAINTRVAYSDWPYTIIEEAKIVLIELAL